MSVARPFYDTLFIDRMIDALNADIARTRFRPITDDLKKYGFFGFYRYSNLNDHPQITRIFTQVMKELSVSNPPLAAQILEEQFEAIGVRRTAKLVNECEIPYSIKRMLSTLNRMVAQIEEKYSKEELVKANIESSEFETPLSSRNISLRFYPDLIFSAQSPDEMEAVRRLFVVAPVSYFDCQVLRYHKRFVQENFDLLTPGILNREHNQRYRVAPRAIALALQGQLNEEKLIEFEKPDRPQWAANLQLAKLCAMDVSGVVFSGFGECLTESIVNHEVACGLMLGIIQEHLDATASDQRSDALETQLFAIRKAFNNFTPLVNHEMAINLFWVAACYAHRDPHPLLEVLKYCDAIDQTKGVVSNSRDNKFAMMLKHALFNTPKSLAAMDVLGLFGRHALERLLRSGVATLASEGNVVFHAPNIKAYGPDLKQKVATFALKCLVTEFVTLSEDSNISRHEAQTMVDAKLFSKQDWQWISGNTTAAANIAQAQLPTNILEIVGDQVLEMALGNALGL